MNILILKEFNRVSDNLNVLSPKVITGPSLFATFACNDIKFSFNKWTQVEFIVAHAKN